MAKKKIKKLLKGLGMGAALLGAGKALMNRRARNAMINSASADDGFGFATLKDYGPFTIGTKRSQMPRENPMLTAEDYNSPMFTMDLKDGGKVVKTGEKAKKVKKKVGIQIKGFGKARTR